ncbi:MAG: hydroxyacylglutathione hydrolase [Bdellovibrionales bacterium]
MTIHSLPVLKDNYVYLLANDQGQCAVVDPGEAEPIARFLDQKRLQLGLIICTHHHADHIDGIKGLLDRHPGIPVWCSALDRDRIPLSTEGLKEELTYDCLGETLTVLHVPGHTQGQISIYLPNLGALFTGDTLFSGGCGRLFEGTPEEMFQSLQKIKGLPAHTRLYFGHEYTLRNIKFIEHELGHRTEDLINYEERCRTKIGQGLGTTPSTLAQELKINPFIQAKTVQEFRRWREARDHW